MLNIYHVARKDLRVFFLLTRSALPSRIKRMDMYRFNKVSPAIFLTAENTSFLELNKIIVTHTNYSHLPKHASKKNANIWLNV